MPSDWRIQCNRKAEDLITYREQQRRDTTQFYHTQRPDLVASGRYTYNRFGLGDDKRANHPWTDPADLRHSAGFSSKIEGDK